MRITKTTYLDYDKTLNKAFKMLAEGGIKKNVAFLVIVGINVGLRIGDLRELTFEQLREGVVIIKEQKTGKNREFKINEQIKRALTYYEDDATGLAFLSRNGSPYNNQHLNRVLKANFKGVGIGNVSSHSLRKTFGRRVWDNDGGSDRALTHLSQIFNHTSTQVTRTYLGIQQETLNDIYMNL